MCHMSETQFCLLMLVFNRKAKYGKYIQDYPHSHKFLIYLIILDYNVTDLFRLLLHSCIINEIQSKIKSVIN